MASSRQIRAHRPSVLIGAALLALGLAHQRRFGGSQATDEAAVRQHATPSSSAGGSKLRTPHQGKRGSWRDAPLLVWKNIGRHRVIAIAAGVTFYALLAIFPAVAALVSLYGLFADPVNISNQLQSMSSVMPGGAIEVVKDQVTRIASTANSTLGITFVVGFVISLWSANAGMKALFDALNVVYDADERRGFIKLNAVSLLFTVCGIVFLLVALALVVVVPPLLSHLPLGSFFAALLQYARWPVLLIAIALAIAIVYRFGPDREHAQWRWITWGSATAAVLWIIASLLFSWYAANFGSYNKTYGSLGAVIGFMTWMWISSIVILLGAELDAVMERKDRGSAT